MPILPPQNNFPLHAHNERLWTVVIAWLMVAGLFVFLANVLAAEFM